MTNFSILCVLNKIHNSKPAKLAQSTNFTIWASFKFYNPNLY